MKQTQADHCHVNMVRTYVYGANKPKNWGVYEDLLLAKHTVYWNRLIDVHYTASQEIKTAIQNADNTLERLVLQVAAATGQKKQQLIDEVVSRRKLAERTAQTEISEIRNKEKQSHTNARAECGLWWHHYQAVKRSFDKAIRLASKTQMSVLPKTNDSFWSLQLEFPRGLLVGDFLAGKSPLIRLETTPPSTTGSSNNHYLLWFATQKHEQHDHYRHLQVPLVLHRPLPCNATIKQVTLTSSSGREARKWRISFTLGIPKESLELEHKHQCGIDIGWRQTKNGLRVAYWKGSDGVSGEVLLPMEWLQKAAYRDGLRQQLRERAEQLLKQLTEIHRHSAFPPVKTFDFLVRLATTSQLQLLPVTEQQLIQSWFREIKKQNDELRGLTRKLSNRRKLIYQQSARMLAMRYAQIVMERPNYDALRKLHTEDTPFVFKQNQFLAAPSVLDQWLRAQAEKFNSTIQRHPGMDTTRCCYLCGHLNSQSTQKQLLTCEGCHETWDQDENAASNLLKAATPV